MTSVTQVVTPPGVATTTTLRERKQREEEKKKKGGAAIIDDGPKSLREIKDKIPSQLFQPSLVRSLYFMAKDLTLCAALYALWRWGGLEEVPLLWPIYWLLQGTLMWAIFVVGHDCGHGSFSKYTWVNDIIGTFLHSIILVPYAPWKLSHRHHHAHTGNHEKDEIFYPRFLGTSEPAGNAEGKDNKVKEGEQGADDEDLSLRVRFVHGKGYFLLGLGFMVYLLVGTGIFRKYSASHFNPFAAKYKGHRFQVVTSLLGWAICLAGAIYYGMKDDWWRLMTYYFIPLVIGYTWLVVITFLHHHDGSAIPWYNNENWKKVNGSLSTVDRDCGVFQGLTHDICTHQVHHLFSDMPHYNLVEATKHFKTHFPNQYRFSSQSLIVAFFENFNTYSNQFLRGEKGNPGVYYYPQ